MAGKETLREMVLFGMSQRAENLTGSVRLHIANAPRLRQPEGIFRPGLVARLTREE